MRYTHVIVNAIYELVQNVRENVLPQFFLEYLSSFGEFFFILLYFMGKLQKIEAKLMTWV